MRRYSLTIRIDTGAIEKAKLYFETQSRCNSFIEGKARPVLRLANYKEWLWDSAFTISIDGQYGIIIPIPNQKNDPFIYHRSETNLLVYQDNKENFHAELIRLLPDCHFGLFSRAFTGCLVEADSVRNLLRKELPSKVKAVLFQYANVYNKIGSIKDYFKCFDNNPAQDHQYEVMLCVSQPEPGTREPWEFSQKHASEAGNLVFVGHVFLVMKEKTSGKTLIRNIGFYPEGNVWPYSPAVQGCLNNDSYTDYNIALNIKVNSHQFNQILDYLSKGNNKGYQYNLNSNNCTSFALDALQEGGINLPHTVGKWHHGSGLNPGDLGQDLRNMKLSSNMKLVTVYQAHGNQGNCMQ